MKARSRTEKTTVEKVRDDERKVKGKGNANVHATKHFDGYCLYCKVWEHMKNDCWWNESAKRGSEGSSVVTFDQFGCEDHEWTAHC